MDKIKKFEQFINENLYNIQYKRTNGGVVAILDDKVVGELVLYNYWSERDYITDDEILNNIIIPKDFEFMGMIETEIENKGIATNMLEYAMETTTKNGIAISKLFIAENAVHTIAKKLNAESIPDWYLLHKIK